MAGRRPGDLHRRVGADAARVLAGVDDLPCSAPTSVILARDLDDGTSHGGHLDRDLFLGGLEVGIAACAQAREHQVWIHVLVVGDQQEAIARLAAERQGIEPEIVVIVAELLFLRRGVWLADRTRARPRSADRPSGSRPACRSLRRRAACRRRVRQLLEGECRGSGLPRRSGERAADGGALAPGAGSHPAAEAGFDQVSNCWYLLGHAASRAPALLQTRDGALFHKRRRQTVASPR